jgi:uncharacterized protein (DUF2062 family)
MPDHHDSQQDTVERSLKQIAHSMQDLTRRVEDISNSPLTRAPARTIAVGVFLGLVAFVLLWMLVAWIVGGDITIG